MNSQNGMKKEEEKKTETKKVSFFCSGSFHRSNDSETQRQHFQNNKIEYIHYSISVCCVSTYFNIKWPGAAIRCEHCISEYVLCALCSVYLRDVCEMLFVQTQFVVVLGVVPSIFVQPNKFIDLVIFYVYK